MADLLKNVTDSLPIPGKKPAEPEPVLTEAEKIAAARNRIGEPEATASFQEEDGEYTVVFSLTDYLDIDTTRFNANVDSLETEGGCSSIQDSEYEVCGASAIYPITATSSDVVITASVNGVEKETYYFDKNGTLLRTKWISS